MGGNFEHDYLLMLPAVLKYLLDDVHIKSLGVIGFGEHIVQRDPAVRVSVRRDADPQTVKNS